MLLFVRTLTGKALAVEADNSTTIGELKKRIEAGNREFHASECRMVFAGKLMRDHLTVGHYNLAKEGSPHIIKTIPQSFDPVITDPDRFESDTTLLWTVNYFEEDDTNYPTKTYGFVGSESLEDALQSLQVRLRDKGNKRKAYLALTCVPNTYVEQYLTVSEADRKYQPASGSMKQYSGNELSFEAFESGINIHTLIAAIPMSDSADLTVIQNPVPSVRFSKKYQEKHQELLRSIHPAARAMVGTLTAQSGTSSSSGSGSAPGREISCPAFDAAIQSAIDDELPLELDQAIPELQALLKKLAQITRLPVEVPGTLSFENMVLTYLNTRDRLVSTSVTDGKLIAHVQNLIEAHLNEMTHGNTAEAAALNVSPSEPSQNSHAASSVPVTPQEQPHYIMVDHGGVLDGTPRLEKRELAAYPAAVREQLRIQPDDLVYRNREAGIKAMPKGRQFIMDLNELINEHGYRFAFHSANVEKDQFDEYAKLRELCEDNQLPCPPLHAMAVLNDSEYPFTPSTDPEIKQVGDVRVATYGADSQSGKASVRRALEAALSIGPDAASRSQHVVLDDGVPIINASRNEGYRGIVVSNSTPGETLADAVHQVLLDARAARHVQSSVPRASHVSEPSPASVSAEPARTAAPEETVTDFLFAKAVEIGFSSTQEMMDIMGPEAITAFTEEYFKAHAHSSIQPAEPRPVAASSQPVNPGSAHQGFFVQARASSPRDTSYASLTDRQKAFLGDTTKAIREAAGGLRLIDYWTNLDAFQDNETKEAYLKAYEEASQNGSFSHGSLR
ncbi:ubiquitin-like protein [Legionella sp. CNM-4043-24]|uniref:ubiquitin-like protein n=1 Tax=Legionella sp. CNM-4043-24 TaxID=3421646 RepID=UPI00403B3118